VLQRDRAAASAQPSGGQPGEGVVRREYDARKVTAEEQRAGGGQE
jgi:hypothetical protein